MVGGYEDSAIPEQWRSWGAAATPLIDGLHKEHIGGAGDAATNLLMPKAAEQARAPDQITVVLKLV